jgi:YbgC/YbaW family acyl-CoA thioester hydrolase
MSGGSNEGPARIVMQRRIEWWDTDASGNYHNTAAFRLLESAETLLLARLGFLHEVYGRLPRAHVEADFRRPLGFHDLVDVDLRVHSLGRSSITYRVEIRRGDDVCVEITAVAVLLDEARGKPVEWPAAYRDRLLLAGTVAPELLPPGTPEDGSSASLGLDRGSPSTKGGVD